MEIERATRPLQSNRSLWQWFPRGFDLLPQIISSFGFQVSNIDRWARATAARFSPALRQKQEAMAFLGLAAVDNPAVVSTDTTHVGD